ARRSETSVSGEAAGISLTTTNSRLRKRIAAAQTKTSRRGITPARCPSRAPSLSVASSAKLPIPNFEPILGIDLLDQAAPSVESVPSGKMRIEHRAGALPHFGEAAGICAKTVQCPGKQLAVTRLDDEPAIMMPDEASDFAVRCGDRDDGSAGGG